MYTFIAIVIVIASILLTLCVLLQNSKGGGLAANFASGNQAFGVRQTADILEKATWGIALTIIALCILATAFVATSTDGGVSDIRERIEQATPVQGQPQFPAPAITGEPVAAPATTESTDAEKTEETTPAE